MSYPHFPLAQELEQAADRMDKLITRITRQEPFLRLSRESDRHWIVEDYANEIDREPAVMFRSPDPLACERFIRAFASREACTVNERSVEQAVASVRVPDNVVPLRKAGA